MEHERACNDTFMNCLLIVPRFLILAQVEIISCVLYSVQQLEELVLSAKIYRAGSAYNLVLPSGSVHLPVTRYLYDIYMFELYCPMTSGVSIRTHAVTVTAQITRPMATSHRQTVTQRSEPVFFQRIITRPSIISPALIVSWTFLVPALS
jgi:hypothetical protein